MTAPSKSCSFTTSYLLACLFAFSLLVAMSGPTLAQEKGPVEEAAAAKDTISRAAVPPPEPLLPIPTARQLDWQRDELRMFVHFTVNTFMGREWGTGKEDPDVFAPTDLDTRQWARVAKETGFKTVILTAKHHDGFALWPSDYTDHDVASSRWRGGEGDVVGAFTEAMRAEGLKSGLYLSPWDRHEPTYGDEEAYNAFYLGQLRELLSEYGTLSEVWFDGAKGEDAEEMAYHFDAYWATVRQLQPEAVIFSDAGPDVRWVGNEHGFAGKTNWSTIDRADVGIGEPGQGKYLQTGERGAPAWVPAECDVSIRPGWFWHADEAPKTLTELREIYYKSVGRNCVLLLNVPPDTTGQFAAEDVKRLRAFREAIDAIYETDVAKQAQAEARPVRGGDRSRYGAAQVLDGDRSTYWATGDKKRSGRVTLLFEEERVFNVVRLAEPIALGQRVAAYRVEAWQGGAWKTISEGTTIGYKKLDRLSEEVTTRRVRVTIEQALAAPLLAEIGLHLDPHPAPWVEDE